MHFGSSSTDFGLEGQKLALLVDFLDEVIGSSDIVLRDENPDFREISLSKFGKCDVTHRAVLLCVALVLWRPRLLMRSTAC